MQKLEEIHLDNKVHTLSKDNELGIMTEDCLHQ